MIGGAKIGVCNVDDAASAYSNEPMSSVSTNDHSTGICEITSESDEDEEEVEYDITNVEPEYDLGNTNYREPSKSTAASVLGKRRFLNWQTSREIGQKVTKRKRINSDISENSEDLDDIFGDSTDDAIIDLLRSSAPPQMTTLIRQNAHISMNTNNLTLFL